MKISNGAENFPFKYKFNPDKYYRTLAFSVPINYILFLSITFLLKSAKDHSCGSDRLQAAQNFPNLFK